MKLKAGLSLKALIVVSALFLFGCKGGGKPLEGKWEFDFELTKKAFRKNVGAATDQELEKLYRLYRHNPTFLKLERNGNYEMHGMMQIHRSIRGKYWWSGDTLVLQDKRIPMNWKVLYDSFEDALYVKDMARPPMLSRSGL